MCFFTKNFLRLQTEYAADNATIDTSKIFMFMNELYSDRWKSLNTPSCSLSKSW